MATSASPSPSYNVAAACARSASSSRIARAADHAAAVGSAATASATVAANPLTSVASLSVRGRFALTVSTAASSVSRRTGTSITYAR